MGNGSSHKSVRPLTPHSGELWLVGHSEASCKQLPCLWGTHHRCISHMGDVWLLWYWAASHTPLCTSEKPKCFMQRGMFWQHLLVATIFPNCFWFVCLHQTVLLPSDVLYTLYKGNCLKKSTCQILSFQCRQTTLDLTCQAVSDNNQTRLGRESEVSVPNTGS